MPIASVRREGTGSPDPTQDVASLRLILNDQSQYGSMYAVRTGR